MANGEAEQVSGEILYRPKPKSKKKPWSPRSACRSGRGDPGAPLDLQELVDRCYRNGRYGSRIDYSPEPDPPLEPADAGWAHELAGAP